MLRGLLLALLLANLAFFVWSQGGAGVLGGNTTSGEHEPERLSRQWHPEAVQLMPAQASSAASAPTAASPASAASTPAAGASDTAASAPVAAEVSASAASAASAASTTAASASSALVAAEPTPAGPPGTRCLEAGPFGKSEWAAVESALASNAKTRRMARRWVQEKPDAASAAAAPQRRLRIDATPDEVAVLEALPASVVGRSFGPCTTR